MLNDLKGLIAIDSVKQPPENNAPFGNGARRALDFFLERAAAYGLVTGEDNGYCGWAEYGEGELIGVLAHLDIVPVGDGWVADPLTLTERGGNLYGRGVADDKGGAVAVLHALKSLKDEGYPLGARVRLIVGCDEESGCHCMKHYAANCEIPRLSFTPDAEFPVICSEKGISHLALKFAREEILAQTFEHIRSGDRANVVPAQAECLLTKQLAPTGEDGITVDGRLITAHGKAAHGSTPENGDNAAGKLLRYLSKLTSSPAMSFAAEYLAGAEATERLGISVEDEKSGRLTMNLGIVRLSGGELTATLDIRRPLSITHEELVSAISAKLPTGATIETVARENNLYVDERSPLITTLLGVYKKHFGKEGKPLKIGGGTYAKALPNCVAFGPTPEGENYRMHDSDEYLPKALFYKLKEIYRDGIIELAKLLQSPTNP